MHSTPSANVFRTAMRRHNAPEPAILVIFGATGDLTKRKLMPALFDLWQRNLLSKPFYLVGVGRQAMDNETFRNHVTSSIDDVALEQLHSFRSFLHYEGGDMSTPELYQRLRKYIEQLQSTQDVPHNVLFYLSTPPQLFQTISDGLGNEELQKQTQGWRRIIIEKPFGHDLKSARELNQAIQRVWQENQIFRIDHYLGKETVQNLMAIRFGNAIFEPIWNRSFVDHVQITAAEDLGLENRAGYYENIGVVRDMLQNHLMQLLTLTAMEPPISSEADTIRDEKVKVLRAIQPLDQNQIQHCAIRGQYGAGHIYGEPVVGYREEPNVSKNSLTPTYVALKLEVNNWRWKGVPFFLRTGKRLSKKVTEIAIVFKRPPTGLFPYQESPHQEFVLDQEDSLSKFQRNVLAFRIQPDEGVSLKLGSKLPGQDMALREVTMDFQYDRFGARLEKPYSRLLLDAFVGDATLFPREDEVDYAWQIIDALLKTWDADADPNNPNDNVHINDFFYDAGTWGPKAADKFIGEDRRWRKL